MIIEFICYIGSLLLFMFLMTWFVNWSTHLSMNKDEYCDYGWGNFKQFILQFNTYNKWQYNKYYNSFFGIDNERNSYEIHADIIKFNNMCMNLYPWSYLRFCLWLHHQSKIYKQKIKW